ncbi:MAG: alpha/beta fold hydrolase [Prevotellaceae bacterium]|jgi:pimeloyl-ACP methyl ester carboxylesterase|nr:alpha/beta fold hydrolase [Prevotellaceae bacterium]
MEYFKTCRNIPVYVSDSLNGAHTLVLLHGYLETNEVWADFASLLTNGIRIIAIDLPGHGLSGTNSNENSMEFMADVLAEVLHHAKIEKATVAGHSMGGYAALAFAEKYPEMLEKLCLFHSTPNPDTDEKKQNRDREIALIRENRLASILNINIPNMFATENRKRMDDCIVMISENATVSDTQGIIACLEGMKNRKDMNAFLAGFDKPLLLIFGKKDKYIAENVAKELVEKFPEADVLMLENSGHAGFLEEPETSANKIREFVTG